MDVCAPAWVCVCAGMGVCVPARREDPPKRGVWFAPRP
jgi:hypothetical protein